MKILIKPIGKAKNYLVTIVIGKNTLIIGTNFVSLLGAYIAKK